MYNTEPLRKSIDLLITPYTKSLQFLAFNHILDVYYFISLEICFTTWLPIEIDQLLYDVITAVQLSTETTDWIHLFPSHSYVEDHVI